MPRNLVKRSLAAIPLVGVVAMAGAMPAQASLEGSFGINPFTTGSDQAGGITLEGTGITAPNGVPLTNIDFLPPEGPGVPAVPGNGAIVEVTGNGDFAQFQNWTGTVLDLAFDSSVCGTCIYNETNSAVFPNTPGAPGPVARWLSITEDPGEGTPGNFDGGFTARLDNLLAPRYIQGPTGTTVVIDTFLTIFKLDEDGVITGDDPSTAIGTISGDFVGLTSAEVQAEFTDPGQLFPNDVSSATWSGSFVASKDDITDIPEGSNLISLLGLGLAGASSLLIKRKS